MKFTKDTKLDYSVGYENVKLMSNLMILKINRNSLQKMTAVDLHEDTVDYIKTEYTKYIHYVTEKIKTELNKTYRLN